MKTNQLNSIFENTAVTNFWHHSSPETHIALIAAVAFLVHVMVKVIRHASEWFILQSSAKKNPFGFVTHQPKFITLTRLIVSGVTFVIYFLAVGFILVEGFHAYADVQFSRQADQARVASLIAEIAQGTWMQFQAVVLAQPEIDGIEAG